MKRFLPIICVVISLFANAQEALISLDLNTTLDAERVMADSAMSVHPEVKPYSFWTVRNNGGEEWLVTDLAPGMVSTGDRNLQVYIKPLVSGQGYAETGTAGALALESYAGLRVGAAIRDRLRINGDVITGYNEPLNYLSAITDSLSAVPGYGHANRQGGYGFYQSTINVGFKASRFVELHAGRGKHFIGEGYRSMFLSDYAPNYNYLRTDVNVWRIKYTVLYNQMRSAQGYPDGFYPLRNKYSTMHYLSLNVTKWWSVGAFEAVVWESEDSVQNREFDIHYLNPIIFFRPVEYSLGSSDNSLLGFSSTLRPALGLTLYGQLMIDELVIRNALAPAYSAIYPDSNIQTGWFGNKQSFQLGVKWNRAFRQPGLTLIAEINAVRPYMYSHSNQNQTYTHMSHALAHPLGANFIEWLIFANWKPSERLYVSLLSTLARKGFTNHQWNMGEDPARANADIVGRGPYYDHFIGQGRRVDMANTSVNISYDLVPAWNLRLQTGVQHRYIRTKASDEHTFIFSLGITTSLWRSYRHI